ncbi:MAG: ATP-binding cassette domain-containing protein [Oligoflexus sp.]
MNQVNEIESKSMKAVYNRLLTSPRIILSIFILAPFHTIAPHVYNWYLGRLAHCQTSDCHAEIDSIGITMSVTISGLIVLAFLSLASRSVFWASFEIKASEMMQDFFNQVIHKLKSVRATWFDEHPSGKLINRLFGDFSNLQRRFVFSLSDGQVCYHELIAGLIMVAWINPWGTLPILLFWGLVFWAQTKINPAFDYLSALSSKKKGHVMEVLSDVIEGSAIYRSYQAEEHILERLRQRIIDWVGVEAFQWRLMTWAWTWMWLLAEAGIAVVVLSAAWAFQEGHIEAAVAGMILIAAGNQQNIIPWTLDNIGGFLTSRAKALRFLSLGQLADETIGEHATARRKNTEIEACPNSGMIEFKNFTGSYREDSPIVLRKLNLSIPQGTKLALIGRTGSGKSTIIQALFRMLHVHCGDITIDGCSIYDYSPSVTRSIFGIVPQNPWLFAGSLRDNIDLKGEFDTQAIKQILLELEIDHFKLDDQVEEGGKNYSVGERQIICLARCLLSDKKIIVMDEPTSNIDQETDAKIQKMIRSKLTNRTLIVIAHRKETIADFEMFFSMDQKDASANTSSC